MQHNALVMHFVSLVLFSTVRSCSDDQSSTQSDTTLASAEVAPAAATRCDASLWNHVYKPTRLQQLAPCISVTGTIDESNVDADGDQHFLLKLDPGQDSLLNRRNQKKKSGDIVLEIVCANPTTMKKPKAACAGYTNPVPIPPVGAHVRATGTYVIDSNNGWAEIHPVSKVERM